MLLRWQSKPRFDASRPASGRLPAKSDQSKWYSELPRVANGFHSVRGWDSQPFRPSGVLRDAHQRNDVLFRYSGPVAHEGMSKVALAVI